MGTTITATNQTNKQTSTTMKVANFMVPRNKVVTCGPDDSLETAIQLMLEHVVGSVIVMPTGLDQKPVGIVTKTDLIRGWSNGLDAKKDTVQAVMGTKYETVLDTSPVGLAAEHFEKTKHRHAFVIDANDNFVGIVTSYDIAVETARDNRSWPYVNRDELAEKFKVPAH